MKTAFIGGAFGFIGFHLAESLVQEAKAVAGYDGMTDYCDLRLKERRIEILRQKPKFTVTHAMLEDNVALQSVISAAGPDAATHLTEQAEVRCGLENPLADIDANTIGTFNVIKVARNLPIQHLLIASTTSVYSVNETLSFVETAEADTQITLYAATQKANESMAHPCAHNYHKPVTMFRFFSAYGPWGRLDMALFKFTKVILAGELIGFYSHADMWRGITFVSDLVRGIMGLITALPAYVAGRDPVDPLGNLGSVAPFRIGNIGNSGMVRLQNFIEAIESEVGRKGVRNYMPMQTGDVPPSWVNTSLLQSLTGYCPQTDFRVGVASFV